MSLENFGWSPYFSQHMNPDDPSVVPGRVCSQHRSLYRVFTEASEVVCNVSGHLLWEAATSSNLPTVGDWVMLRTRALTRGTIQMVLPRRSQLSRRAAGTKTQEQIIAANVDTVFIVTALDDDFSVQRMERYLSLTVASGADPVLILNKSDLSDRLEEQLAQTEAIAQGAPVHPVSGINGDGLSQLRQYLGRGQTVVFVGSSGVGKSTLINALLGAEVQATKAVRSYDNTGRHTTTYRRLIPLPGGAMLLDTPGMREVQLWAGEEILDSSFADIAQAAAECRFRDCTHQHEPGCAVRDNVAGDRLESFHKQQKELAYLNRESNVQWARAEKQKWRAIHKTMRNYHPHG